MDGFEKMMIQVAFNVIFPISQSALIYIYIYIYIYIHCSIILSKFLYGLTIFCGIFLKREFDYFGVLACYTAVYIYLLFCPLIL